MGRPSDTAISATLPERVWNVPYSRNPHFTGRDELLDQLDQQLSPGVQEQGTTMRRAALTQPRAIKGLGGVGKTQIAVEYAFRSLERDRYTHIFWVSAASEEVLLTSFTDLAKLLPGFPVRKKRNQRELVGAIKRWLELCPQRWLLIFDNADDVALLRDYLPHLGNGSILLTTRADAVGSIATSIEVETMGLMEGSCLLLRRAYSLTDASDEEVFEHVSAEKVDEAGNIVISLDALPLALDQAGAYIEETKCSLANYLQMYQDHRKELHAKRGSQATNYPDSVATTWSLSFQKVEQANPAAAELLHLCAFLAPDKIPEELVRDGAAYWPPLLRQTATDLFTFDMMIADLLKFSLVKRLIDVHMLSIHRLVQAVQMDMMEPEAQRQWAERVTRATNDGFPHDPHNVTVWPQCLRYLDQAQKCYVLIERYGFAFVEAADVLSRTGGYLFDHGLYSIVEPLYQRALLIQEQTLGPEHLDMSHTLNELAILFKEQSKYTEAESLYLRALDIQEKALGPEHPDVAITLSNLAELYQQMGKYAEAEPLYQRALTIQEKALGPVHPDLVYPLGNLAGLYTMLGRFAEAEPLYQRALRIREQVLGHEHSLVAGILIGLANLYSIQEKYEEAEPLYRRALLIQKQALGPVHPDVGITLSSLAYLYKELEKYEEAEPLCQEALHIQEKALGLEHPNVAYPLSILADIYFYQEKYAEAEPLYQRALLIREKALGPEHFVIAGALIGLADLYSTQGKYAKAEPLYQRALPIQERVLGPEHPDIASTLNDLADLYYNQEKYEETEPLYRRVLAIRERQLGTSHPDTVSSLNNLALLYEAQGKYTEAEPLYRRALSICKQQLGRQHPTTQTIQENHTALLRMMKEDESTSS